MRINDLINALYLAKDDTKLVKRLEQSIDADGCCIASTVIFEIMNRYRAGKLKGQGACIFSDMLMGDEMLHVAETAIVEGAAQVVDAYLCGGLTGIGQAVETLIEDQLKEQPEYAQ